MLMMNSYFISRGFPQSSATWYYWNWTELRLIVNMLIFTFFANRHLWTCLTCTWKYAQWQRTEIHGDIITYLCIYIYIHIQTYILYTAPYQSLACMSEDTCAAYILQILTQHWFLLWNLRGIFKQCEMFSIKSVVRSSWAMIPKGKPGTLFDRNIVYKQRIPHRRFVSSLPFVTDCESAEFSSRVRPMRSPILSSSAECQASKYFWRANSLVVLINSLKLT